MFHQIKINSIDNSITSKSSVTIYIIITIITTSAILQRFHLFTNGLQSVFFVKTSNRDECIEKGNRNLHNVCTDKTLNFK